MPVMRAQTAASAAKSHPESSSVPAADVPVAAATAPPEVVASAVAAVQKLGAEVVKGHYQVAIDRMVPSWKERMARRMGGMEELQKQLAGLAEQMSQQGVSMISFKPDGEAHSFEVWPGKKKTVVDGKETEDLIYTKWLVIIPTVTQFRIMKDREFHIIESRGFQVAVADKGANDWTFIDGSGVTVADLRSLFLTLPADVELPPIERREVR
jgi:hypothetical protein